MIKGIKILPEKTTITQSNETKINEKRKQTFFAKTRKMTGTIKTKYKQTIYRVNINTERYIIYVEFYIFQLLKSFFKN